MRNRRPKPASRLGVQGNLCLSSVCVCVCAGVGPLEVALSFFIFMYCAVEHSHLCVQLRYFHSVLLDASALKK